MDLKQKKIHMEMCTDMMMKDIELFWETEKLKDMMKMAMKLEKILMVTFKNMIKMAI